MLFLEESVQGQESQLWECLECLTFDSNSKTQSELCCMSPLLHMQLISNTMVHFSEYLLLISIFIQNVIFLSTLHCGIAGLNVSRHNCLPAEHLQPIHTKGLCFSLCSNICSIKGTLVLRKLEAICKMHWSLAEQNLFSRLLHSPERYAFSVKICREEYDVTRAESRDETKECDSCTPSMIPQSIFPAFSTQPQQNLSHQVQGHPCLS